MTRHLKNVPLMMQDTENTVKVIVKETLWMHTSS